MRIFGGTNFVCITCGNNGRHYLSVGIRVLTTMKVLAIKISNLHLYALYATFLCDYSKSSQGFVCNIYNHLKSAGVSVFNGTFGMHQV